MNAGIQRYLIAFAVTGVIALAAFGSGEITVGLGGLAAIALVAGGLAAKLAGR